MKIAACVILYNPDKFVIQNIQSYINHVDKIYLIDNSESINIDLQKDYNAFSNTIIIHNGINEGISKRLNEACELAVKDGFDYLLTMDQDSYFEQRSILSYLQCIGNFREKKKISMFGINYKNNTQKIDCSCNSVKFLITSGSVINLESYKKIGGFDESLFIDFVDAEYCFRSIQKSFKIIEFANIYMHHSLGESVEKYSLKTLKKTKRSFHSSTRLYYMTRNFFYLNNRYKTEFADELRVLKKDLLNRIKNKLLYESARLSTLKILYRAIKDFKNKRMGKIT